MQCSRGSFGRCRTHPASTQGCMHVSDGAIHVAITDCNHSKRGTVASALSTPQPVPPYSSRSTLSSRHGLESGLRISPEMGLLINQSICVASGLSKSQVGGTLSKWLGVRPTFTTSVVYHVTIAHFLTAPFQTRCFWIFFAWFFPCILSQILFRPLGVPVLL